YLRRNWDGIRAWRRYEGIWQGCSAEGHVSHVYAARLSSRPMAWSRVGVPTMARLRVWQANGGSARAAYLHGKPQPPLKVSSRCLPRLREEFGTGRLLPAETLGNMPALRGHRTPLTRALRALSQFTAVCPGPTVRSGIYPPPCDSGLTPSAYARGNADRRGSGYPRCVPPPGAREREDYARPLRPFNAGAGRARRAGDGADRRGPRG